MVDNRLESHKKIVCLGAITEESQSEILNEVGQLGSDIKRAQVIFDQALQRSLPPHIEVFTETNMSEERILEIINALVNIEGIYAFQGVYLVNSLADQE